MFGARVARGLSVAASLACAGCAANTAPRGWLLKPAQAQAMAYGGWIELTHGDEKQPTSGELIAVSADSVWILGSSGVLVVPTSLVKRGKLTGYAAQTGPLTGWVLLGTFSTISNGALLIFMAPMWIIGGSLVVGGESRAAQRQSPPLPWVELAAFARFPQGLPEGMALTALEARVVPSNPEP